MSECNESECKHRLQKEQEKRYNGYSETTIRKIEKYKELEDITNLHSLEIDNEIKSIRKGLLEGNKESFFCLVEYMWLELVKEDSMLRGPLRGFIERNMLLRLNKPYIVFALVFIFDGEYILKEWSLQNMNEMGYINQRLSIGSKYFYSMHSMIRQEKIGYKEINFLKSMFVFTAIGGTIDPRHINLLLSILRNSASSKISVIFGIYKVFLGCVLDVYGKIDERLKENNQEMYRMIECIEECVQRLIEINVLEHLVKHSHEESGSSLLFTFTKWQLFRIPLCLPISKECKMKIISIGRYSTIPDMQWSVICDLSRLYHNKEVNIKDILRNHLLHLGISQGEKNMIVGLAEESVHLIEICLRRKEYKLDEILRVVLATWANEMDKTPLEAVAKFLPQIFYCRCKSQHDPKMTYLSRYIMKHTIGRVNGPKPYSNSTLHSLEPRLNSGPEKNYPQKNTSQDKLVYGKGNFLFVNDPKLKEANRPPGINRTLLDHLVPLSHGVQISTNGTLSSLLDTFDISVIKKLSKSDLDLLTTEEQIMLVSVLPVLQKRIERVDLSTLIILIKRLKEQHDRTGALSNAIEGLCSVIEKFIEYANDKQMICLFLEMIQLPVVDPILSQINHIIISINNSKDEDRCTMPFGWVHTLNLSLAKKKNLKCTFLTNALDVYLVGSQKNKAVSAQIIESFRRLSKENDLDSANSLSRSIIRANALLEKQKDNESTTAHPKIDIIMAQSEERIITVQEAVVSRRTEIYTNLALIKAVVEGKTSIPIESVCDSYESFSAYFNVFSSLILHEALASIKPSNLDKAHTTEGHIKGMSSDAESVDLLIEVKDKSIFSENDIVLIDDVNTNICLGRGIVKLNNTKPGEITVSSRNIQCNSKIPIKILVICNIVTHYREYDAIIRLQRSSFLNCILDPKTHKTGFNLTENTSRPPLDLNIKNDALFKELNISQKLAVRGALSRTITLIQGPPGTGKTKTIICIITQLLYRNLRVLVCAPSNAAVDMLVENIQKWTEDNQSVKWTQIGVNASVGNSSIPEASLVFSTLSSARSFYLSNCLFDVVIVDEACQATEPSTLIPLRAKPSKLILVGDPQQLPPTVISQAKGLSYTLFERLSKSISILLLKVQYRMHPEIAKVPNDLFYKGELKNGTELQSILPIAFVNINGSEECSSQIEITNREEAHAVSSLYSIFKLIYSSIGVITPYKGQASLISQLLPENAEVSTVDGFQGQEKSCILLSAVRTIKLGFLTDIRRLNVAITRAKSTLVILGNRSLLQTHPIWNALIEYTESINSFYSLDNLCSTLQKKIRNENKDSLVLPPN
ncbi:regulator of nonsense transcripts 1 [Nematocida sp. AWRm80]|nr:regulator of nonsense transcripts 1 [Nematocida sp. AWRm80]